MSAEDVLGVHEEGLSPEQSVEFVLPPTFPHCCTVGGLHRRAENRAWGTCDSQVRGSTWPAVPGCAAPRGRPHAGSHHPGILTPARPQIVYQNRGRKACDRPVAKKKKKKAEGTVFTEEDFQKFQQEYFGS